jgi:VanZ family protein
MPPFSVSLSRLAFFLFWPALALIVWGELTPHPPDVLSGTSDKLLHFTAYFGLAALAALALRTRRAVLIAVLGLVALGGVLEILQSLTGRDAEWLDEAANSLGVALGALASLGLLRLVGRARPD